MPIVIAAAIVLIGVLMAIYPPPSPIWGEIAIIKATYITINTVSCSFRADAYAMRKYITIRSGQASRPAARSTRLPIGLRLPSRPSCPIAFCSRPVHRPAIARRLSSLESRRRSPSFSLFRPACRIDGRGDALGGTESETGVAIGCCGKTVRVFDNCRHVVENSPSRRKA